MSEQIMTMSFFNSNTKQGEEQSQRRRSSVRELEAKAYARWLSLGRHHEHKVSGFEAERARRHSLMEEAGRTEVGMKSSM
jgi:hypothetical protein